MVRKTLYYKKDIEMETISQSVLNAVQQAADSASASAASIDPRYAFTPLVFPPSLLEVVGYFVLLAMATLSTAGGIGAAGSVGPLIMVFFSLSIFECVPITNFFGLTAAVTRFCLNFRMKHPNNPDRLVVYYDMVELAMPLLYLGSIIGVQIGTRLTEVALVATLASVLLFLTVTTA